MISDEDKDRVRAATDLVELVQETVQLKQRGQEFWGCCPFHGEKTPSFHIIPATQVWHCFGCGEGGDCFTYVMKRENLSFPEAIRYLADRAGIEIADDREGYRRGSRRTRIIDACEAASQFFHTMLMRGKDDRPRAYFASRNMGGAVCRRYRLGFAPGRGTLVAHLRAKGFSDQEMIDANLALRRDRGGLVDRFFDRVMFPIFDERGACIAFGGRIMGTGEPKYLNTAETSVFHKKRNLYGFNWAKDAIIAAGSAVVVEGYTDAIACYEAGIGNVVATLGTALTAQHVKTLTRFAKKIIYLFDGDAAGQKAAERAIQFIENDAVDLRCVVLPDNKDPMEFITSEGGPALQGLLDTAEPLLDFVFRKLEERSDLSTPGGRTRALEDACRLIYPLRDSYVIDGYYMQIADRVGLDVENVRAAAPRVFREVQREEEARIKREQARERAQRDRGRDGAPATPNPARSNRSAAKGGVGRADGDAGMHSGSPSNGPSSIQRASAGDSPQTVDNQAEGSYIDDEVPLDVYDAPASSLADVPVQTPQDTSAFSGVVYTDLERRALTGERELLTLLTASPDAFRSFADRIVDIDWVDPRHEAIAWAVLATPEGSDPAQAMDAARSVCPEAAQLVAAGRIGATSKHATDVNIKFLLDSLELYTVRRHLKAAQARLRQGSTLDADERRNLMIAASQGAARMRELEHELEGVADPFAVLGTSSASAAKS